MLFGSRACGYVADGPCTVIVREGQSPAVVQVFRKGDTARLTGWKCAPFQNLDLRLSTQA